MKHTTPRLKEFYAAAVVPELVKRFKLTNTHQVPRLEKIIINIGLSDARENIKVVDSASAELAAIAGQKPRVTRARKSISNFKLREGMPIGVAVTLRADRMYEFFDRLVNVAIPRIRDFRGLEPNSFDGRGNYNLGLNEQYIFPEVNVEKSDKVRGMNITIVTSAKTDEHGHALLALLNMPFKKREQSAK